MSAIHVQTLEGLVPRRRDVPSSPIYNADPTTASRRHLELKRPTRQKLSVNLLDVAAARPSPNIQIGYPSCRARAQRSGGFAGGEQPGRRRRGHGAVVCT